MVSCSIFRYCFIFRSDCVPAGLVCGFVTLRSFMTVEATDVLWELLECAREVIISHPHTHTHSHTLAAYVCVARQHVSSTPRDNKSSSVRAAANRLYTISG